MKIETVLRDYDCDLILRDAFEDRKLCHSRRMLAGATIGIDLATAYYGTCQLIEAVGDMMNDHRKGVRVGEGYLQCENVLDGKNPYQMRIWHLICDLNIAQAVSDLGWLKMVTYQRATAAKVIAKQVPLNYFTHDQYVEGPSPADLMSVGTFSD